MDYKLIRQKRRTVAIKIADGEVVVKAPYGCPIESIQSFVESKSNWINKKLSDYARKIQNLSSVIDENVVLYCGMPLKKVVSSDLGRVKRVDGNLFIPQKYADNGRMDAVIKSWYKRTATVELKMRIDEISAMTKLKYKSFSLTNAKTKWGSCDGECNIMLNWRLVMLDPFLVDYVIVHELSHTVHHDHSKEFWSTVEKFFPDYKIAKKQLKDFSILTSLYR